MYEEGLLKIIIIFEIVKINSKQLPTKLYEFFRPRLLPIGKKEGCRTSIVNWPIKFNLNRAINYDTIFL